MNQLKPIDRQREAQVRARTTDYIDLAGSFFGRRFDPVEVTFDLSGKAAGMYRVRGEKRVIRYNPWIFSKYFDDNLAVTVPHEVAHYICEQVYGLGNIKPHGREWKQVMDRFGADASRTCDYDLSGIPVRKTRKYRYECGCDSHWLGSQRHNRVNRGEARYLCRRCGQELRVGGNPRSSGG